MTTADRKKLSDLADSLVPVAGELMRRVCGDRDEHTETCSCNTCRAFQATQNCITVLADMAKET